MKDIRPSAMCRAQSLPLPPSPRRRQRRARREHTQRLTLMWRLRPATHPSARRTGRLQLGPAPADVSASRDGVAVEAPSRPGVCRSSRRARALAAARAWRQRQALRPAQWRRRDILHRGLGRCSGLAATGGSPVSRRRRFGFVVAMMRRIDRRISSIEGSWDLAGLRHLRLHIETNLHQARKDFPVPDVQAGIFIALA